MARRLVGSEGLAAAVIGKEAQRSVLLAEADIEMSHFRQEGGRFSIDGLNQNVLHFQRGTGADLVARVDGKPYRLAWPRGASNILPPEVPLTAEWNGVLDLTCLWLKPALCARLLEAPSFDLDPALVLPDKPVAHILGMLVEALDRGEPYGRLYRDGLVTSLVAYLAATRRFRAAPVRGGLPVYKRRRILDYIEANLAEDIRLAELAALAEMSAHHFCASFKRSVHASPHRYLIERRLLLASRLLRDGTGGNVTAVAMLCGFKSSAHFATAFRRRFGLTPTQARASD